jgi:hypothetical protein
VVRPLAIDMDWEEDSIYLEDGTTHYPEWVLPAAGMNYTMKEHSVWAHWVMVF